MHYLFLFFLLSFFLHASCPLILPLSLSTLFCRALFFSFSYYFFIFLTFSSSSLLYVSLSFYYSSSSIINFLSSLFYFCFSFYIFQLMILRVVEKMWYFISPFQRNGSLKNKLVFKYKIIKSRLSHKPIILYKQFMYSSLSSLIKLFLWYPNMDVLYQS